MPARILHTIILAALVLLTWNAATTNVWDDETNGYFFSRLPFKELLELMAKNAHEDPPLYDVMLWNWMKVAAYDPLLLRLPSILFWVGTLLGIRRCGDQLSEGRAGLLCAAVAAVMPIHWMFPAAMRWYSLFACFAVWNFASLIVLLKRGGSLGTPWRTLAAYAATGTAMWYTNYSAPAVFLAHGVVALIVLGRSWRRLGLLLASWVVIGLLYLPWLPVFIRQLGHVVPPVTLNFLAASLYALWAGEVSTPFAWWISVPALAVAISGCGLILMRWRLTSAPALMVAVLMTLLIVKNAIWTKRLMIFSPYLAMAIGLAVSTRTEVRFTPSWLRLRLVFAVSSLLLLVGSLVNEFRREGWLAYRWLMPVREVVEKTLASSSGAVFLTNSNSVAFYGHDPVGLNITSRMPERAGEMTVLPFYEGMASGIGEVVKTRLTAARSAVYIHESSGVRFTLVRPWLNAAMKEAGYEVVRTENHAEASAEYLRFHPSAGQNLPLEDRSRLVTVFFRKSIPQ